MIAGCPLVTAAFNQAKFLNTKDAEKLDTKGNEDSGFSALSQRLFRFDFVATDLTAKERVENNFPQVDSR